MSQSSFSAGIAAVQLSFVCLQTGRNPGCLEGLGPWVSPKCFTACEKKSKTYLAPKPFFLLLDSFVYYILWVHHSGFSTVKILLSSYSNNLTGLGIVFCFVLFSCDSYISLYIIPTLQKLDCQLHVGKKTSKVLL